MTWAERASKCTPGGAQTRSKRTTAYPQPFPGFLTHGRGASVWDVDGNKYVDWICGLASISLGYQYPAVDEAVMRQLRRGVSFSLPTTYEVQVAEQVCAALGAEQVRFVKTGSEATEGAMRIARLATGRKIVLSAGYHGWHTIHDLAGEHHPGAPYIYDNPWWGVKPNDLTAIENIWEYAAPGHSEIAAVIIEATRDEPPPEGYLEGLRELCTREGVLLIFDEVVTGFRWALRGASEYFGVTPDLSVYGKGMANGYPLACIVGPEAIMRHASYVSGTFGGECLSLAAASATLSVFDAEPVIKHLWSTGQTLQDEFNRLMQARGADLSLTGYAVHPRLIGPEAKPFISALAAEGVLWHPSGFNVSYSHREAEIDLTLAACARALGRL